jgi:hypothetical protein
MGAFSPGGGTGTGGTPAPQPLWATWPSSRQEPSASADKSPGRPTPRSAGLRQQYPRNAAPPGDPAVPGSSHGPGEPLTQQCPHHHGRGAWGRCARCQLRRRRAYLIVAEHFSWARCTTIGMICSCAAGAPRGSTSKTVSRRGVAWAAGSCSSAGSAAGVAVPSWQLTTPVDRAPQAAPG